MKSESLPFRYQKIELLKKLKTSPAKKELSMRRVVYERFMIVEVANLRNNQILINFLSEAWEPACDEIKHECNSNADCKMGTQCVQTRCAALCKGESGMNSDCEVSFTQKFL